MKIIKVITSILVLLIAIPLVIAVFVKKDINVEREIIINKNKDEVFSYVVLLKNQNNFSKWAKIDPKMETSFKGTDGTVGFISAWRSLNSNVGAGEQEITKISESRIDYEIRFLEPMEMTSTSYMIVEKINENETKVKWGFNSRMKYPSNLMLLFMNMEQTIAADIDEGLNNLKNILEKNNF